jgi:O-antigen ligase
MALVSSAVSTIYLLLFILSVIYIQKLTPTLSAQEKTVLIGFAAVFFIYLLGMLNSDDIYSSFKKLGKFSYFLFSAPVFMLFRYYQRSMLTVFYIGTTLSGFILLIYLLLNSGSTGAYHSIMYGDFSMLIAGINALLSLLTNFNRTDKVLLALSALSALSASLIVGAKGSWVALPLLLLIFLYLLITQKQLRLTIMKICIGIVLTICVTISVFPSQTIDRFNTAITNTAQFVDNEHDNKKQPAGTASERFIFWKAAINTAREHPFFGSGSGDFGLELKRFTTTYPQYNVIGDSYRSAHNIFFEWLALFGIVGFLALMVSVFLLPLKFFLQTIKNNPEKSWAGLVGIWIILSSMVFGLTETWITRSAPNGVYMFFVLSLMAFSVNNAQSASDTTLA